MSGISSGIGLASGINTRQIIDQLLALDARGKTPLQTIESLRGLPELIDRFERPVMLAVSRKDFVGALTHRRPRQRAAGTLAAIGFGLDQGATVLRVHDVAVTSDYLRVREALLGEVEVSPGLRIAEEVRREPPGGSERR